MTVEAELGKLEGVEDDVVIAAGQGSYTDPAQAEEFVARTGCDSLAVAIGYPDLVSTGGTILGQTGQAIEVVLIWMVVYLSLSLLTSGFMNWFNARHRLVGR